VKLRAAVLLGIVLSLSAPGFAADIDTRHHTVRVVSNDPAISGQRVDLYLRERVARKVGRTAAHGDVVLFVHGAGTPAEVSFDVPFQDYSWMGFLAAAGYDVFSVDMTGYGRSTRPPQMADRCNLSRAQQMQFGVDCPQAYPGALTNIESDWNDVGAAVDYIRKLRHVERVALIGWSQGGPRAGGWTAQHSDRVSKLILLAPAYNRAVPSEAPALPVPGPAFGTQSREEFIANWDRQALCPGQYEPAAAQSVWKAMLESDPVGAKWTPAVRRAPISSSGWGWTQQRVAATTTPTLLLVGEHDKQVDPARVRDLYADLGAERKVLAELACASHNAMWEKNHLDLFRASLEWLREGTVNGMHTGTLRLGH